jgi:hypothetical protein
VGVESPVTGVDRLNDLKLERDVERDGVGL